MSEDEYAIAAQYGHESDLQPPLPAPAAPSPAPAPATPEPDDDPFPLPARDPYDPDDPDYNPVQQPEPEYPAEPMIPSWEDQGTEYA